MSTYYKPNMASLPPELGREIIRQIMNTPKPDFEALHERAVATEREIARVRQAEDEARK